MLSEIMVGVGLNDRECNRKSWAYCKKNKFRTVKKVVPKGSDIPRHNHEQKEILFVVVLGEIEITLDDQKKHLLSPEKLLSLNGEHYIQGTALEDTTIFVTLIDE